MFSGIVEKTGTLHSVTRSDTGDGSLIVSCSPWEQPYVVGESIAVNGVCLTLTSINEDGLRFDLLDETFQKTNLGSRGPGDIVNLERSLRLGDTIGGHFVTGHVDGVGITHAMTPVGRDWIWSIHCPENLLRGMVPKGSIACDGISLTIVDLTHEGFTVHIIPHTWEQTTVRHHQPGVAVNLEIDMLGKYVQRYVASIQPG